MLGPLFEPEIGVAKTPFHGAQAIEVFRGASRSPLYVTAIGMADADAAREVGHMHGPHRVPTLLRRVDQLARRGLLVSRDAERSA